MTTFAVLFFINYLPLPKFFVPDHMIGNAAKGPLRLLMLFRVSDVQSQHKIFAIIHERKTIKKQIVSEKNY